MKINSQLALGTAISSISLMITIPLIETPASAFLLGDTVRAEFNATGFGNIIDETDVVVDPGIEFSRTFVDTFALDVKSDSFDIIYTGGGVPFIGADTQWILSDINWVNTPGIVTGVTLASGDNSLLNGISFTDDSITVNVVDFSLTNGVAEKWSFDIQTSHKSTPEPSTILGLLAVTGLGLANCLKRNLG